MTLDRLFLRAPFDSVRQLLLRFVVQLDAGLSAQDVEEWLAVLRRATPDDDLLREFSVRYRAKEWPFAVEAFPEPPREPEVLFLAPAVLTDVLLKEAQALGIPGLRLMRTASE